MQQQYTKTVRELNLALQKLEIAVRNHARELQRRDHEANGPMIVISFPIGRERRQK